MISMDDWRSVSMSSNFFQIATPASVCPIQKKNCGTDFRNFDFEIFGKFLKFKIWPTAAQPSGPILLTVLCIAI